MQVYQLIHQSVELAHKKLVGTFALKANTKVAIVGENGIGKTSFLKYLKREQQKIFQTQCSIVDQIRLRPIANLQVSDIYELVNKELKDFLKEPLDLENSLIKKFDFMTHNQKKISELSGGENQILKILIALNLDVEVYILDEPFSNLSLKNKTVLKDLIKSIDKTFLIIDHDQEMLSEVCSQKFELYDDQSVLKFREIE